MKRLRLFLLAVFSAGAVQVGLRAGGIVVNGTPSLPLGIYRKENRPVQVGAFILFRLPPAQVGGRTYAREPLIKRVAAVEGDCIRIAPSGVSVNGTLLANSAQLSQDREGRPLPQPSLDEYTLRDGEILAMSTYNARSFDSRYFGPIRREWIVSVLEPVLTWNRDGHGFSR